MSEQAKMLSKKAIELSLNFIVILIITLVVFGFGVKFISDLSSKATEIQDVSMSELDNKIGELICEGSERVCLGIERKTITRTNIDTFGLKIINIFEDQHFEVKVLPSDPLGYTKNKQPIQPTDTFHGLLIIPSTYANPGRDVLLKKNEEKSIGIAVEVPANAEPGTYIFNIEIKTADGKPYSAIQKLYVDVPK